jgi:putative phage-type endonuclease
MDELTWHRSRQKGIGSSDAPCILGVSTFKTPFDIYQQKISPEPIVSEETPKMRAGKELEGAIADWWGREYAFRVIRDNKFRFHSQYPFMFAELDRIAFHPERGAGLVEVKNTERKIFEKWRVGEMPLSFYIQTQHQFACTGLKWGALVVLMDGWDKESIDLFPDPEFIADMEKLEVKFWNENVIPRIPPALVNMDDVKSFYPAHRLGKSVELDPVTFQALNDLMNVKTELADLSAKKDLLEFTVANFMQDAEIANFKKFRVASFKKNPDTQMVDMTKLSEERGELLTGYMKPRKGARILRPYQSQLIIASKEYINEIQRTQTEVKADGTLQAEPTESGALDQGRSPGDSKIGSWSVVRSGGIPGGPTEGLHPLDGDTDSKVS